ncbi:MAG TPA: hypothetical protein VK689_21940 [Armatimonadota bacterium]|nr:hypothetical protein [Armatimonadota bacterium]
MFHANATGVFSSRKTEPATRETAAFRFLAGTLSPDHDTTAAFRKTFLPELQGLFVPLLWLAREARVLEPRNLSLDGAKIHAAASKSKAVSYGRFLSLEAQWREEVQQHFALAEQAGAVAVPEGTQWPAELARREARLARLAEAKAVLEARLPGARAPGAPSPACSGPGGAPAGS